MNKKLILGIALSLVLASGAFFSAQADCCLPHISFCNLFTCGSSCNRDMDVGVYNPFPERVHSLGVTGCCGGQAAAQTPAPPAGEAP